MRAIHGILFPVGLMTVLCAVAAEVRAASSTSPFLKVAQRSPSQVARSSTADPAGSRYRWRGGVDPAAASAGLVISEVLQDRRRCRAVARAPGAAGEVGAILHDDGDIGVGTMQLEDGEMMLLSIPTNAVLQAPEGERAFSIKQVRLTFVFGGAGRERQEFMTDARGSRDIRIEIAPEVGETRYAGLTFNTPCVLDILADGTLITRKAGVTATDKRGKAWVSRRVVLNGKPTFAFLPR